MWAFLQSEIENKQIIGEFHSFLRHGGWYFCNLSHLILVTLHSGRGGVQGDLASVIKYAGFFIYFLAGVRGMLVLISCVCLFVCLSETNLLSLRALPLKLKALSLFLIFLELISLLFGYITCMWHYPGFLVLV